MLGVMFMQKNQGKRSKVKVTEVKSNFAPIWSLSDCNVNWQIVTKRYVVFFKINRQSSRSHGTKNRQFLPELSIFGL